MRGGDNEKKLSGRRYYMNFQIALDFFDIIGLIMMCAVIIVNGLAAFWNISF
jgi:hypothetical protein